MNQNEQQPERTAMQIAIEEFEEFEKLYQQSSDHAFDMGDKSSRFIDGKIAGIYRHVKQRLMELRDTVEREQLKLAGWRGQKDFDEWYNEKYPNHGK